MKSLEQHIEDEAGHLARAKRDRYYRGYILNRTWLAINFLQTAYWLPENPKILEVGIGDGSNLRRIVKETPKIKLDNCTGTCLQLLPEHEQLRAEGLSIVDKTLIEELPTSWDGVYHVVMASLVLSWADNLEKSIERLSKVTSQNGYLLCFDVPKTVRKLITLTTDNFIEQDPRLSYIEDYLGVVLLKQRKTQS